jgi:hypothetical protein
MTSAISTLPQLAPKDLHYSATDIALIFLKERVKDVVKILRYTAYWSNQLIPGLPSNVVKFGSTMGDLKNFLSATEIPERAVSVLKAASVMGEQFKKKVTGHSSITWQKVGESASKVLKESSILTNNISDTLDFSTRFIAIDKTFLSHFQTFNFGSAIVGNGIEAIERIQNINTVPRIDTRRKMLHFISLARAVSYVAFGALGLFFTFSGIAAIPWVLVACVTSGLLFTIGGYFYEKIYDPEEKGKNLKPSAVIENMLRQRRA